MSVIVNIVLFCAHLCVLCSGTPARTPVLKPAPTPVLKPAPTPAPTPSCQKNGYEFSNRTQHCYKLYTQAAYWPDANRTCVVEGARLAVANSADEERVLMELFERYPEEAIHDAWSTDFVCVGIYRQDGVWRTVDGQTLAQSGRVNWYEYAPKDEDTNPYVAMNRDGRLGNVDGSVKLPFICEM